MSVIASLTPKTMSMTTEARVQPFTMLSVLDPCFFAKSKGSRSSCSPVKITDLNTVWKSIMGGRPPDGIWKSRRHSGTFPGPTGTACPHVG